MEKFIFYKGKYYTKESIKQLERSSWLANDRCNYLYDAIGDYCSNSKDILKDDFCFGGCRGGFWLLLFIVSLIKIGTLA